MADPTPSPLPPAADVVIVGAGVVGACLAYYITDISRTSVLGGDF